MDKTVYNEYFKMEPNGIHKRIRLSCNCLVERTVNYKCAAHPYNQDFKPHENDIEDDVKQIIRLLKNTETENNHDKVFKMLEEEKPAAKFLKIKMGEEYEKLHKLIVEKKISEQKKLKKTFVEQIAKLQKIQSEIENTSLLTRLKESASKVTDFIQIKLRTKKEDDVFITNEISELNQNLALYEQFVPLLLKAEALSHFLDPNQENEVIKYLYEIKTTIELMYLNLEHMTNNVCLTSAMSRRWNDRQNKHYFIYDITQLVINFIETFIEELNDEKIKDLNKILAYESEFNSKIEQEIVFLTSCRQKLEEFKLSQKSKRFSKAEIERNYEKKAQQKLEEIKSLSSSAQQEFDMQRFNEEVEREEKGRIRHLLEIYFERFQKFEDISKFIAKQNNEDELKTDINESKFLLHKIPIIIKNDDETFEIKYELLEEYARKIYKEEQQKIIQILNEADEADAEEKKGKNIIEKITKQFNTALYELGLTDDVVKQNYDAFKTAMKSEFAEYKSSNWKSEEKSLSLQKNQLSLGS